MKDDTNDVDSQPVTPHHTDNLVVSYHLSNNSDSMQIQTSDVSSKHDNFDHCDGSTFCSSNASDRSPPSLVEEEDTEDTITPLYPTSAKSPQISSYRAEDDDEDDEEMIQYNYNNGRTPSNFGVGSTSSLRRTPGANAMHRSAFSKHSTPITLLGRSVVTVGNRDVLRRTPGANMMHRSVAGINIGKSDISSLSEGKSVEDDTSAMENSASSSISNDDKISKLCKSSNNCTRILGYGLAMPSPLVSHGQSRKTPSDRKEKLGKSKENPKCVKKSENSRSQGDDFSLSPAKSETVRTPNTQSTCVVQNNAVKHRPPLDPNSSTGRENYLYTPAEVSLANNRDLNLHANASGTMSPTTIQLATSLDNLLDDEGDVKRCEKNESKGQTDVQKDSSFHSFTRASSESSTNSICIPSSSDVTPVKGNTSPPRPANFSSGGAFSPPTKPGSNQSNQLQPSFQSQHGEGTYVKPTPKKAGENNSPSNYQYHHTSQKDGLEEHRGDSGDGNKHPLVIHNHFHCSMPPMFDTGQGNMGFDPNMYTYHSEFIRGPALLHSIPSPLPFQHEPHLSVTNTHVDYDHHQQHHVPHHTPHHATPSVPVTAMNSHPYPIHNLQYQSLSPVPFSPQHVIGAVTWSGHNPHATEWEHPTHLSSNYAYNGMGPPIMSTPNPPHVPSYPSWLPSEYENYNGSSTASIPTPIDESVYHNMSSQNSSYQMQHVSGEDSTIPHYGKCAMKFVGENDSDRPIYNYEEYSTPEVNRSQLQEVSEDMASHRQRLYKRNVNESFNCNISHKEESLKNKSSKQSSKNNQIGSGRTRCSDTIMESNNEALKINSKKGKTMKKKKKSDSKRRNKENQTLNVGNPKTANIHKVKKNAETRRGTVITNHKANEFEIDESKDSNTMRSMFKEFYRTFRLKEKTSLVCAANFAKECLGNTSIPDSMHWRIYLELADIAKRENNFPEARKLFYKVCSLQPHVSQGWLEFSKLEEESGNLEICSQLLSIGLQFCECDENLLTRAIKHEEKMAYESRNGDLSQARKILAPLKKNCIDKVWRSVLEGAMMESRAGNDVVARRILKYLMHSVPWYGPLYLEAFRLERDAGYVMKASSIVERGLKEIPRYGPLWFGAIRLCEELDIEQNDFTLPRAMNMVERATKFISRELIWKVHLEAARAQERAANSFAAENNDTFLNQKLDLCRQTYVKTICACPEKLSWKVWLAAGRMELSAFRFEEARRLFLKSFSVVPTKGRPIVMLECSRLEEFVGNIKLSRALLCKSRTEAGSDWKVYLQSAALETRCGNRKDAIQLVQKGLNKYSGTGRLWAILVQLREADGLEAQLAALKKSLNAVPKSGEVWCEAARMFMNPLSSIFDVAAALHYLSFATKFTPQYGDSFLETLRLLFLQKMTKSITLKFVNEMKKKIEKIVWECHADCQKLFFCCVKTSIRQAIFHLGNLDVYFENVDTSQLELRCSNADPNYGQLWFHCRRKPTDRARTVLRQAKEMIEQDIREYAHVYMAAVMRRAAIEIITNTMKLKLQKDRKKGSNNGQDEKEEEILSSYLRSTPNVKDIIANDEGTKVCEHHVMSSLSSAKFVTGLVVLNEKKDLGRLSLMERQRIIFGNDLMLPSKIK